MSDAMSGDRTGTAPPAGIARRPWRRYLAEGLGTFAIVFAGCGAVVTDNLPGGEVGHVGVSLTFGFVVAAMIYALGPISAAHFNPAVTLAFASARRFPWRYVPAYILAQVAGALAASGLHGMLFGGNAEGVKYGATVPAVATLPAATFEGILTFLLMLVIMAVATDRRVSGAVPGLAIGLTVAVCALFGGPATGASMNPARSLGPAVLSGGEALAWLPLYLLAPPVGAVLAALTYELLRDGAAHAQSAPADLEGGMAREPGLTRENETR